MITPDNVKLLRRYARQYESVDFLTGDPSWFMHQVEGRYNQETMAFIASTLSYGSRELFMPKIHQLLDASEGEVYEWVCSGRYRQLFSPDDGHCFYRLYSHATMFLFLDAYQQLMQKYGSLGDYVRLQTCDGFGATQAISQFFSEKGVCVVVPKNTLSACKRLCMFLRWMVRSGSPVDLGLWADFIDRRTLIMPLDTHVVTQALRLGLLHSHNATMNSARQLSETLKEIFPDDPLLGDFALFGYGINHSRK